MKSITSLLLALTLSLSCATATLAQAVNESLAREAQAAIDRGLDWLEAGQQPEGNWSNEYFPALTGLPLWALSEGGRKDSASAQKAIDFILRWTHEDGSIYREPPEERKGGGLSGYNTSICMVALHRARREQLAPVVLKARRFTAKSQHLGDDQYRGGMGYDPGTGRPYADLSNSVIGYEAMRLTEDAEDLRPAGTEKADLDWQAAQEFLAKVQNPAEDPDVAGRDGGFIYKPGDSKAGQETTEGEQIVFRSYGSMTYAGLLSLIYADVDRDDPRVRSAFDWTVHHWTLEENPGMGQEGLFYFYNILSKALATYGVDQFTLSNEQQLNWREALIKKLLSLQKIDPKTGHGYWVNEQGRWWEADPVLVTSYTLIALETALGL